MTGCGCRVRALGPDPPTVRASLRMLRSVGGLVFLGTIFRAVVRCVLCVLAGFAAPGGRCCLAHVGVPWLWPAACLSGMLRGLALVRCACLVWALSVLRSAFLSPWCLLLRGAFAPGPTGQLPGARGGRPSTRLMVPAAGPYRGRGAGLPSRRTCSGPRDGVVHGRSLRRWPWAAGGAIVWRVWTPSLMRPVSRTAQLSTGASAGAPGLFCVDANICPCGSEDATPSCNACACACSPGPGWAGQPPGPLFGAPHLSFRRFVLCLCAAPSRLGLPLFCPAVCLLSIYLIFSFVFPSLLAPPLSPAFGGFRLRLPLALALCAFLCPPAFFLLEPCALLVSVPGASRFPSPPCFFCSFLHLPSSPAASV